MGDTRKLPNHLAGCEHADSRGHEVKRLIELPTVLVHERPHVILQVREDALNGLQGAAGTEVAA